MKAWQLGSRKLLAASCRKCGKLVDGQQIHRHRRKARDPIAYVDRRCPDCKWGAKLKGKRVP